MKRIVFAWLLGAAFVACTPDVPQTAGADVVFARFAPPTAVPTPTDLVRNPVTGLLNIPTDGLSAAQAELVSYLNTLDGYPSDTPARATFTGELDQSTVKDQVSVLVLVRTPTGLAPATGHKVAYSKTNKTEAPGQISLGPPLPAGWTLGRTYIVVLLGGTQGLKGTRGQPVVGSSTWALLRLKTPLVQGCTQPVNLDGTCNPACRSVTDVIPSNETDPDLKLKDQGCSAAKLEAVRLAYQPILDGLQATGVAREDVVLLWTFTITSRPQLTFDPVNKVIPFPNDLLTDGGVVALPPPTLPDGGPLVLPDGGLPDSVKLIGGLNTLDGFSTTAPIVSVFAPPGSPLLPALNQGKIADSSLDAGTTGVVPLGARTGGGPAYPSTLPSVTACLDPPTADLQPGCIANPLPDGGTPDNPQQLQLVPKVPLDERSRYGVFVTTGVQDTNSKNVIPSSTFALLRLGNPLLAGTTSTIDLITDEQAQQLEPGRLALKPFLDFLALQQIPREKVALAWAFSTQSEVTTLGQLHNLPSGIPTLSTNPVFVTQVATSPSPTVWVGEINVPQILNGPDGTLSPGAPTFKKIWFILALPAGSAPASGWPVTIFGHGLTRTRSDSLAISSRSPVGLTVNGQAVIATDVVWHGDRSFCVSSKQFLAVGGFPSNDDFACIDPADPVTAHPGKCDSMPGSPSFGRCIATAPANRAKCDATATAGINGDFYCTNLAPNPGGSTGRQGLCLEDLMCEGGDFRRISDVVSSSTPDPTPLISGWNILNLTNLFATRDNFRQQVIDLAQLYRVITQPATAVGSLNNSLGTNKLDTTKVNYVGQSLGGVLGSLYTSVAPGIQRVVLNVPGGDFTDILLNSTSFAQVRAGFLDTLASQGITQGTPDFAAFLGFAKWILDPSDPRNASFAVLNGTNVPTSRQALIQFITRDQTIPNTSTLKLIGDATRPPAKVADCYKFDPSDATLPPANRHGFLLNFSDLATTSNAQGQVVTYINTGAAPTGGACQ
jgi:pimeloyl-ACP methyl ester carboxylesterase